MALPSSWILKKTGFARGMSLGLIVMAIGSLIFIPAANTRSYILFLVGLFVQGTGLALLQTAANPYVTILGPIESAAKRMSIMGLFNKIAGIIGIFFLSKALLSNFDSVTKNIEAANGAAQVTLLNQLAGRIITPYLIIAIGLVLLAIMVWIANLPDIEPEEADKTSKGKSTLFDYPYLILGILALFLYEGVEVMAIDTLVPYSKSIGLPDYIYSKIGMFSLAALMIGYLAGIALIPKRISQQKALTVCALLSIVFSVMALCCSGVSSLVFLILLSFSNSLMWPAIWALAIDKLGHHTSVASALLIMAIVGGALIPLLYGHLATLWNNRQTPYFLFLPCYLYIAYYSLWGCKVGKK